MDTIRRRLVIAGTAAPIVGWTIGAHAQASDYFKDKTVLINVGGGPSGGHARYARLLQPFLQKHLGAKEVRVVLMQGGGGLKAANYVWRAKPDGLNVFFGNVSTLILASLAGSPGATFDPTKFTYLGRITNDPRVLTVGTKSTIKEAAELRKLTRPFVYPSQGTDEDFYFMAALSDSLGFKLKAVTGYEGNADTALAVIKGDGDGHITSWTESRAAIKVGDKMPLLMVTTARSPDYPNIPLAIDLAPPDKAPIMKAMATILEMHRSYIGPPGMDAKAAAAFRSAVSAMLKDPDLIAESTKTNLPVTLMEGAQQQQQVAALTKTSANLSGILKAAVKSIQ